MLTENSLQFWQLFLFQNIPASHVQCSDPESEDVPMGQIVQEVILWFLYVFLGQRVQEPLFRPVHSQCVPTGHVQDVLLLEALDPGGHSIHSLAPCELAKPGGQSSHFVVFQNLPALQEQ